MRLSQIILDKKNMESWHGRWLQCLIDLWDVRGCRKASQLSVIQYANESRWTVGGVVHGLVGARCASNPQPPLHTNWDKFINFSLARSTGSCCSTLSKQRGKSMPRDSWLVNNAVVCSNTTCTYGRRVFDTCDVWLMAYIVLYYSTLRPLLIWCILNLLALEGIKVLSIWHWSCSSFFHNRVLLPRASLIDYPALFLILKK